MDLENLLVNGETLAAVASALNDKINTTDTKATNAATAAANAATAAATANANATNAATAAAAADTKATNAATAAATADTKATNAATAAATAQTTADNKQAQLYLHNIKVIDDSFTLRISVMLPQSNAITTESAITQELLNKALSISLNDDSNYLIQVNSIVRDSTDIDVDGVGINSSGLTTIAAVVDLSISTITDSFAAL